MKRIVQIGLIALAIIGGITVANRRNAMKLQEQERLERVRATRQKILEKGVPSVFPKGASQTEGWLSVVGWDKVQSGLQLDDDQMQTLKKLTYDVIIPREKEHSDDYFVFYHAQLREFWVFYELQKQLYEAIAGTKLNNFYFLRDIKLFVQDGRTIQEWLKEVWWLFDLRPSIGVQLLSVNLAFPGDLIVGESSVFNYFYSAPDLNFVKLFKQMITSYLGQAYIAGNKKHILQRAIEEIMVLKHDIINSDALYGLLLSVFIPNYLVDSCAYMSKGFGFKPAKGYYIGKNIPSTVLSLLAKDPTSLNNIEDLQARLRLSEAVFSDPNSGIKMFLNHNIPEGRIQEYKNRIAKVVRDLLEAPEKLES